MLVLGSESCLYSLMAPGLVQAEQLVKVLEKSLGLVLAVQEVESLVWAALTSEKQLDLAMLLDPMSMVSLVLGACLMEQVLVCAMGWCLAQW